VVVVVVGFGALHCVFCMSDMCHVTCVCVCNQCSLFFL
jgi:hypothetical protein